MKPECSLVAWCAVLAAALPACYPDFEFVETGSEQCSTQAECPSGDKCSVSDEGTGALGCVPAGERADWGHCTDDAQCLSGSWCDHTTQTCKPTCQNSSDCGGNDCVPALTADGVEIPQLKVCLADCHPIDFTPCHQLDGATTCVVRMDLNRQLDCWSSGGVAVNWPCESSVDCAGGALCLPLTGNCRPWCTPPGTGACDAGSCTGLTPAVLHEGIEYGVCSSL